MINSWMIKEVIFKQYNVSLVNHVSMKLTDIAE